MATADQLPKIEAGADAWRVLGVRVNAWGTPACPSCSRLPSAHTCECGWDAKVAGLLFDNDEGSDAALATSWRATAGLVTLRMRASLSAILAIWGKTSLTWKSPRVGIAENGPRTSRGASGFGSHEGTVGRASAVMESSRKGEGKRERFHDCGCGGIRGFREPRVRRPGD